VNPHSTSGSGPCPPAPQPFSGSHPLSAELPEGGDWWLRQKPPPRPGLEGGGGWSHHGGARPACGGGAGHARAGRRRHRAYRPGALARTTAGLQDGVWGVECAGVMHGRAGGVWKLCALEAGRGAPIWLPLVNPHARSRHARRAAADHRARAATTRVGGEHNVSRRSPLVREMETRNQVEKKVAGQRPSRATRRQAASGAHSRLGCHEPSPVKHCDRRWQPDGESRQEGGPSLLRPASSRRRRDSDFVASWFIPWTAAACGQIPRASADTICVAPPGPAPHTHSGTALVRRPASRRRRRDAGLWRETRPNWPAPAAFPQ